MSGGQKDHPVQVGAAGFSAEVFDHAVNIYKHESKRLNIAAKLQARGSEKCVSSMKFGVWTALVCK